MEDQIDGIARLQPEGDAVLATGPKLGAFHLSCSRSAAGRPLRRGFRACRSISASHGWSQLMEERRYSLLGFHAARSATTASEHRPALVGDAQIAVGQRLDEADALQAPRSGAGAILRPLSRWRSASGSMLLRAGAGPSPAVRRPLPPRSGCRRSSCRCRAPRNLLLPLERQFLGSGGVAAVGELQPAVGTGADAGVLGVTPVDQVVDRFLAGPGVVGDLVGRQAGGARSGPASSS